MKPTALILLLAAPASLQAQIPERQDRSPLPLMDDVPSAPLPAFVPRHHEPRPDLATGQVPARRQPSDAVIQELPSLGGAPIATGRLHVDEPGDGAVWARGDRYKARFQDGSTTYIPYLGPDAPRNFPVTLALQEVRVGEHALELAAASPARREGNSVRFQHPGLDEVLHLAPEGIEQTFELTRLPERAEVVVRVGVESELARFARNGEAGFGNALGEVRFSSAVAIDARGQRLVLETDWDEDGYEIRVPAGFVARASLPLVIDPVVTTFVVDDISAPLEFPDVAYDRDSDSYLVVYREWFSGNDRDTYARRISADGTLLDEGYIDSTDDDWGPPKVACIPSTNTFLAVAAEGSTGSRVISGRTWNAVNGNQGNQFQISGPEVGDKLHPDVGGDEFTEFLVVWERRTGGLGDIHGRQVTSSGGLTGPGTRIISNQSEDEKWPSVSKDSGGPPYDNNSWLVVWERALALSHEVLVREVLWDGSFIGVISILDSDDDPLTQPHASRPLPGPGQRRFVIAYTKDFGSDRDVLLATHGGGSFASMNLSVTEGDFLDDEVTPDIDCNGQQFVVTYAHGTYGVDMRPYAATVEMVWDDFCLNEGRRPLTSASGTHVLPQITAADVFDTDADYVIVWFDELGGSANIHGALYDDYSSCLGSSLGSCVPTLNSVGLRAQLVASGSGDAGDTLFLSATQLPPGQFGYLLASRGDGPHIIPPGSQGVLCLSLPIARYAGAIGHSGGQGRLFDNVDTTAIPMSPPVPIVSGERWFFQYWYRDGTSSNFTWTWLHDFQ
ncbi:MAG: hypothetical protein GY711_05290 [bacterium]|nr:hypothetical protein [bacterium]